MNKSHHEYCKYELAEAQRALALAKKKEQQNITIRYVINPFRKPIMTVPADRLEAAIARIKEKGYTIETVNGKPYTN